MEIRLKIRYSTDAESWLCFRHAVEAAGRGEDVRTEADDYDDEHYLGSTSCEPCSSEAAARRRAEAAPVLQHFVIWAEGYAATGESGKAARIGEADGVDFRDAVMRYMKANPVNAQSFDPAALTSWGCRLFPTEREAKESFG